MKRLLVTLSWTVVLIPLFFLQFNHEVMCIGHDWYDDTYRRKKQCNFYSAGFGASRIDFHVLFGKNTVTLYFVFADE